MTRREVLDYVFRCGHNRPEIQKEPVLDSALSDLDKQDLTEEEIAQILLNADTGRKWQSTNDEEKEYWLGLAQVILSAQRRKKDD